MAIIARTIDFEGATLAFDQQGSGPVLLLVVGGDGNSSRYTLLAALLSAHFTVVKYDRRACFRSLGDLTADVSIAQQARDAAAVIKAVSSRPVLVFGNSGGASIAIKLTEDYPELVQGLVAHEPPICGILDDGDTWLNFSNDVYSTYLKSGAIDAMRHFASTFEGMDDSVRAAPPDQGGNNNYFFAHEFLALNHYVPDLAKLASSHVNIVTAAGHKSGDAYYARTARQMAEKMPCTYVGMSGHHVSFVTDPQVFASELLDILRNIQRPD